VGGNPLKYTVHLKRLDAAMLNYSEYDRILPGKTGLYPRVRDSPSQLRYAARSAKPAAD